MEIKGNWAFDTVCITLTQCVEFMDFFYITEQQSFGEPIDAVLGLARPSMPMLLNPQVELQERKSLLFAMPLTEMKFSTRLQRKYVSWVDFGKPDTQQHHHAGDPAKIRILDDFFWSAPCQGIRFGEDNKNAFAFEKTEKAVFVGDKDSAVYTIFDTGSPDIYLSSLWFNSIVAKLF